MRRAGIGGSAAPACERIPTNHKALILIGRYKRWITTAVPDSNEQGPKQRICLHYPAHRQSEGKHLFRFNSIVAHFPCTDSKTMPLRYPKEDKRGIEYHILKAPWILLGPKEKSLHPCTRILVDLQQINAYLIREEYLDSRQGPIIPHEFILQLSNLPCR